MKKIIVSLLCILIIVIGILLIVKLLHPSDLLDNYNTTTKSYKDFSLFNYGEHFKMYDTGKSNMFDYTIGSAHIKFGDNTLTINDKIIENINSIYQYFSIYDDSLIVIGYTKDNNNYLLNYNLTLDKELLLSNYKDMIIDFKEGLIFEDKGIIVNYSFVEDNIYIKTNTSICDKDIKKEIAIRGIEHYYDEDEKFVDGLEELYLLTIDDYIKKYKICN